MAVMNNAPCALVIGLCSHGLAISRSLNAHGVEVHAFEANPSIPGFITNSAVVRRVNSIKNDSLVGDLLAFRQTISPNRKIVLFPTNDNNVRVIAENINALREKFLISWAECAPLILALLLKNNIESRCRESNLLYPKSVIVEEIGSLPQSILDLSPPYIVKPVQPQSGFKALKFNNSAVLLESMRGYTEDFPVITQEWIEGTAEDLYFCALYMDGGRPLGSFVGRKIESHPPALGQTTVAVTHWDDGLVKLTEQFFAGLDISGPVSLEVKKDHQGNYWVIEPTIGRSDFWLGLCIAGGFDLPVMEYQHASAVDMTATQHNSAGVIWFDSERDTFGPARYLYKWFNFSKNRYFPVFSYFSRADTKPFYRAVFQAIDRLQKSTLNRLSSRIQGKQSTKNNRSISSFESFGSLPTEYRKLVLQYAEGYIFFDPSWFDNFCHHVALNQGTVEILCLGDESGNALAVLPLWRHEERFHGVNLRKITSLANYYTPRFELFVNEHLFDRSSAASAFFAYLNSEYTDWDVIDIYPMMRECIEEFRTARKYAFPYYITENFVHPVNTDYAGYLLARPSRHRNTIKRKYRKLARLENYEFDISLGDSHISAAMAHYHDVYLHSWKIDEPYPQFIDGLVKLASRKGWLRLGRLLINDQVVASQIWFVANDTAYIYKLAYDRNFTQFSPGTLLTCEMIKYVIDTDRVRYLDFLHGNDAFKRDWMNSSNSLYGIQFPNSRTIKGVVLIVFNIISSWKEKWLKQRDWYEPVSNSRRRVKTTHSADRK